MFEIHVGRIRPTTAKFGSFLRPILADIGRARMEGLGDRIHEELPADSGWVLEEAQAIKDQGQIVGHGTLDGEHHAFVMSPVG
jgi:hypothetical protein